MKISFNLNFFIFTLIFSGCALVAFFLGDRIFFYDEGEYLSIAKSISTDGVFALNGTLTASRAPLYPYLLSIIYSFGFGFFGMRVLNIIFLLITLFLLQKILQTHFSVSKYYSFSLVIMSPVFLYLSVLFLPQALGAMLLMTFVYLTTLSNNKKYIYMGFVFGMLCLAIPNFLIAGILFPFVFSYFISKNKLKIFTILKFYLFLFIPISLWVLRNYLVFDTFVPISSVSGFNLFLGNSDGASYNTGFYPLPQEINEQIAALNELEKDKYFRNLALEWISSNPHDFIYLYFLKFLNFFNFTNNFSSTETSYAQSIILFISYYALLLCAFCRFIIPVKITEIDKIIFYFYFISAFIGALFFTRIRYRVPLDAIMVIPAVISINFFLKRFFYNEKN